METLVGAISDSVGTTEVAMQLIIGAFGLLFLGYAFHWEGRRYSTYSAVFGGRSLEFSSTYTRTTMWKLMTPF